MEEKLLVTKCAWLHHLYMKKETTEIKTKERTSFRPSHVKTLLCWRKKKEEYTAGL